VACSCQGRIKPDAFIFYLLFCDAASVDGTLHGSGCCELYEWILLERFHFTNPSRVYDRRTLCLPKTGEKIQNEKPWR
jgi:hypothetical protein